ncbi:hypothetical protein HII31_12465 [Pseudocercospora fuligena]|uniref:Zn(2)-C6 fungal-type domain-containing protein n=1 Tax=Pseudocercospora fuligena TaxID=685502 RepID=A0A8H6VBK7_9PEZI|nr:hypothetical protein HII31_12465 [Pseudocercospora fuligena]
MYKLHLNVLLLLLSFLELAMASSRAVTTKLNQACNRCKHLKKWCSNGTPCIRCKKAGVSCHGKGNRTVGKLQEEALELARGWTVLLEKANKSIDSLQHDRIALECDTDSTVRQLQFAPSGETTSFRSTGAAVPSNAPHNLVLSWHEVERVFMAARINVDSISAPDALLQPCYTTASPIDRSPPYIRSLYMSYLENDYALNPFIEKVWLGARVDSFASGKVQCERSPVNAIVYLVLAIGALSFNASLELEIMDRQTVARGYYDVASYVVGEQLDGDSVMHAQIFLLVALFHWRLHNLEAAMSWTAKARQCVMHLLATEHFDFGLDWRFCVTSHRQQSIVLAAWSAVLIWDSVTADLDLPPTIMLELPGSLPMPYSCARWTNLNDDDIKLHHVSYIGLCDILHRIYSELFPISASYRRTYILRRLQLYQEALESWRVALHPSIRWIDDDSAPDDVLSLRLRSEYWKVCHLIHRSYLDSVLHQDDRDFLNHPEVFQLQYAMTACVQAGSRSMQYLGHMQKHEVPCASNIAHAQYGNMLAVIAVVKTKPSSLGDLSALHSCLQITCDRLREISATSALCRDDFLILSRLTDQFVIGAPTHP